jgi:hypothetical protein
MNAVEAVEQLGVMGRKLQARGMDLQYPVMALRQSADWEKVLGDPVAALSQLLGAASEGHVQATDDESAPEAPVPSLPLAPFRREEDRLPAGSGISTGRSGFGSGQSGDTGSNAGSSSGPAGGMRLARRQTSLLGILNANLEDRVYVGKGEQGRAAALTGDVRPERRRAAQDEDPADLSGPVVRWSDAPSSSAPQDEMRQSIGQAALSIGGTQQEEGDYRARSVASLTRQGMVSDRPGGGPGAAAGAAGSSRSGEGDVTTGVNVWGYESLPRYEQEGAAFPHGGLVPEDRREPAQGTPAERGDEPHPAQALAAPLALLDQTHAEGQAGDGNGWQQNADVVPVQDGVLASADDRQEERPLSMAQIEQVLSALDERLELMLLRMYGSAGGLP